MNICSIYGIIVVYFFGWRGERIADQVARLNEAISLEREAVRDLEQALALVASSEPI